MHFVVSNGEQPTSLDSPVSSYRGHVDTIYSCTSTKAVLALDILSTCASTPSMIVIVHIVEGLIDESCIHCVL